MQQNKIFPMKLSPNYHGEIKPKGRLLKSLPSNNSTLNHQNKVQKIQKYDLTLNGWKKRKSDRQIQSEHQIMVNNPSKISDENPEWIKSTYFYYQKSAQRKKEKDYKAYNIFGDEKRNSLNNHTNRFPKFQKHVRFDWPESFVQPITTTRFNFLKTNLAEKVGFKQRATHSDFQKINHQYVCPKIGFLETRNFEKQKTPLKIGHNRFIDTNKIA